MKKQKGKLTICSRGHKFYKSSEYPVCPICWPGYYRKMAKNDFPEKLSAPSLRALHNAKIYKLSQLAKRTENEVAKFHGMGPNALGKLKVAMRRKKLSFKN